MHAGAASEAPYGTGDRLAREHLGGVLAHALVGVAGARLGHQRHELGGHVVPARKRAQGDEAVERIGAPQQGVGRVDERVSGARRVAEQPLALGRRQRLAQDQLRELDPPPPLHLRQRASQSPNGSSLTVASATAA